CRRRHTRSLRDWSSDVCSTDLLLQRCQLHKRRNVLNHLPDEHQPFIEQKLIAAWNMAGYAEARRALDRIHEELEAINPSAARSQIGRASCRERGERQEDDGPLN